jgi:heme-degrading monooxygenase HmoA
MTRLNPRWIEANVLTRDQFSLQTWLLFGAASQSLLYHFLPPPYSLLPITLYTLYLTTTYTLESLSLLSSSTQPPSNIGRFTAHPPKDQRIVVFLLGFQSSHPLRIMAPGTYKIGQLFDEMFAEAEGDKESGLLGRCGPLLDTSAEGGNGMFTISYWRSEEELKAFHRGEAHTKGMKWYYANRGKYPHLGEFVLPIVQSHLSTPSYTFSHTFEYGSDTRSSRRLLANVHTLSS